MSTDPITAALRELVAAQREAYGDHNNRNNPSLCATSDRRLIAAWDTAKRLIYAVPHDDTKPSRFRPGDRIVCVVDNVNLEKGRVYTVQPPCWPGHEDGKVTVEGNFGHIGCEDCPFPDEYFELVCGVSIIA